MRKSMLKELIKKAIDEYNAYREPEAMAKLMEVKEESIIVEFRGPFCKSCGIYDYFEDLIYELMNITDEIRIEVNSVEELGNEGFVVKYRLNLGGGNHN
ncbi:MAG: hypothetical protein QXG01_08405 [Candidatus Bathyarchaeia archaeon]